MENELIRRIVKLFKGKELLKIGDRSYVNAFKYPLSRFDRKELLPNGGDPGLEWMLHWYTIVPPSSLIFKWGDGLVYDKRWWGRVYGGIPNASAVIQSAINALTAGGKILIKAGRYLINSKITLKKNVAVEGEGYGHEVADQNVTLEQNTNDDIFYIGDEIFCHISNLTLYGRRDKFTAGHGIHFKSSVFLGYYSTVENVFITNFPYAGLIIEGNSPTEVRVRNVLSAKNGTSGFVDIGGGNHRFELCVAGENDYNGFEIKGSISTYEGCVAWSNHIYGFYVLGIGNKIVGAQAYDNYLAGLVLEAVNGLTPKFNDIDILTIDNNRGVWIKGGENNLIRGLATQVTAGRQPTGVRIEGGVNNVIDIESYLNGTVDWDLVGGTYLLKARRGLTNSGTATIAAGSTFVDVVHGLAITPDINKIAITPQDNLGGRSFWVSNVTATTFRINISSTDTVNHAFGWSYE